LESTYESAPCIEFSDANLKFTRQPVFPAIYKGRTRRIPA
jgi:hypothetical protein